MEEICTQIMNIIEKEIPLLEKDAEEWAKQSKAHESLYKIYKLASDGREF